MLVFFATGLEATSDSFVAVRGPQTAGVKTIRREQTVT